MMREFREGFAPLDDWSGMVRQAQWSDMFFNYVPAEQSCANAGDEDDERELLECAKMFIEAHADCPYTAESLVKEFISRI